MPLPRPLHCPFATLALLSTLNLAAAASNGPIDFAKRNHTIESIYKLTVYPHNVPIISNGSKAVPLHLFNVNTTGRVAPMGNFTGFDDSIEYFFALAPTPQAQGVASYRTDVVSFQSECPNVASSLVYLRSGKVNETTGAVNKSQPTSTLSQAAFWRFDSTGAVLKYNPWIPQLQAWTIAATGVDLGNPVIQKAASAVPCPMPHAP